MDGFRIDTSDFLRATSAINERAQRNTLRFVESAASEFERAAKPSAVGGPVRHSTDQPVRQGVARRNPDADRNGRLRSEQEQDEQRHPDYLEILEFGHNSLKRDFPDLSVLYPTRDALVEGIKAQYGDAVLRGMTGFKIPRSKAAMRARARAFRKRQK